MRYTATLTFDYKDARSAEAVEAALSVDDAELSASVQRESRVDGASVVVTFRCDDAKQLRVSVGGFFELAEVASAAVAAFA